MSVFAGIDGGQSSTLAVLGDERTQLGRGGGPPADLVGEARDSSRQRDALSAALDAALDAAGFDRALCLRAIVAGISGFESGISRVPDLRARGERVTIVHDTEIAHAGALDGAAGIVVIAGTGSVALGNDVPGGAYVRAGGWGYFFGDEGGALWVARSALRRAMLRDDRREASLLGDLARAAYGTPTLRALVDAFAHGEVTRPALAAFASDVLQAAAGGDGDAVGIRAAAARELAALVLTVDRRLAPAAWRFVSYAGGLFADGAFVDAFGTALQEAVPHANLISPVHDPAGGALLMARKLG